jgi:hypothetical protein
MTESRKKEGIGYHIGHFLGSNRFTATALKWIFILIAVLVVIVVLIGLPRACDDFVRGGNNCGNRNDPNYLTCTQNDPQP